MEWFNPQWAILAAGASVLLLWLLWMSQIGFLRASLAAGCRIGWVIPVFLSMFPETTAEKIEKSVSLKPIYVLVDDSSSMSSQAERVEASLERLESECLRYDCALRVTYLSELRPQLIDEFSPLDDVLESWVFTIGGEPWVFISDGGDWHPSEGWSDKLAGVGMRGGQRSPRGLILGAESHGKANIWISRVEIPPFSFQNQPLSMTLKIARNNVVADGERVQLQVSVADKSLGSVNATFEKGDQELIVPLTVPSLEKGQHLLTVRALPIASETSLWDNERHAQIEVLPNTIGVLHLLGAPSMDGRFLRRYLKSEPKFDLISFFILRDPWDSQQVNERELSLIPFPTKRLFQEELPNFRVVVIQNFALFQFLEAEYQQNLVQFVKNGGSMLFIGGPRALQSGDIASSALGEILPFHRPKDMQNPGMSFSFGRSIGGGGYGAQDKSGPYYDENLSFRTVLANPDQTARSLANVVDDWEVLSNDLYRMNNAKGLHRTDHVKFKEGAYTPLLDARLDSGKTIPLAVASYPGKGRALWLFSDSLWRLAMQPSEKVSRQIYYKFIHSSMNWLMRQEIKQPLVAKNLRLKAQDADTIAWSVGLHGPATKYFQPDADWSLKLCGKLITFNDFTLEKIGSSEVHLKGRLPMMLAGGQRCQMTLEGSHVAFGSVKAGIAQIFPKTYRDGEVGGSLFRLLELSRLSGAKLLMMDEADTPANLDAWLADILGIDGIALPSKFKSSRNFYWILQRWWVWLLFLLIPLEILVRRWHLIMNTNYGLRAFPGRR